LIGLGFEFFTLLCHIGILRTHNIISVATVLECIKVGLSPSKGRKYKENDKVKISLRTFRCHVMAR